jgi:hypothetical protein
MPCSLKQKTAKTGLLNMKKSVKMEENSPVQGQDIINSKDEVKEKPASHGEVGNQKGSDFSELEESRMENPPKHRETNGSEKNNSSSDASKEQQNGVG